MPLSLGPDYPPLVYCPVCCVEVLEGDECQACSAAYELERRILAATAEGPRTGRTVTVRFTVVRTATDRTYSTNEVVKLTGLTYRQVDYWIRRGVLGDSNLADLGSGGRRRFSASDVNVLRAICAYVRIAQPTGGVVDDAIRLEAALRDAPPGGWLIVTEEEAAVVHTGDALVELLLGRKGAVVVPLPDVEEIPASEPDLLSSVG